MRPLPSVDVVAGEERHHREALHGQAEVAADHGREPVGLALDGHQRALDLLVVLELDLVELDQLDGEAGGAGDADHGVLVGREDLLHVAVGDEVAHRGAAVAGHDDAAGELERHDRRAVRRLEAGPGRQRTTGRQQPGASLEAPHGTTIVARRVRRGVVMAGDRRATMGTSSQTARSRRSSRPTSTPWSGSPARPGSRSSW